MRTERNWGSRTGAKRPFWKKGAIIHHLKVMILEAMYNGEFYPCETVVPTSPEYRKAVIACEKLMEQLSQRLSKEDYELVQELRAQTAIAQCEESESHFKYGFSAGLMFSRKPMNKCSRRKKNR